MENNDPFLLPCIDEHTGLTEFPVCYMRGGTSTGLIIHEAAAPAERQEREELLRLLMGVPLSGSLPGNNQLTGLGRLLPTTNKVFFVSHETAPDGTLRLNSTLAQLAADHSAIDWSVNCGNMSAAIPLWAFEHGLLAKTESPETRIFNTNTGVSARARLNYSPAGGFRNVTIPGIHGSFPGVDLFLENPVGAKTGTLLPTGKARDTLLGIDVSCVDVAVPMVILKAADAGISGRESVAELSGDRRLMSLLQQIWAEAGLRMGLKNRAGEPMSREELERSETVPKVCLVSAPENPGSAISARYFTPQKAHASMAVTGGCCLAAAVLIDGSVAQEVAVQGTPAITGDGSEEMTIAIDNPAGTLEAVIGYHRRQGELSVTRAAYSRSAQMLMKGRVPLYGASPALIRALKKSTEAKAV